MARLSAPRTTSLSPRQIAVEKASSETWRSLLGEPIVVSLIAAVVLVASSAGRPQIGSAPGFVGFHFDNQSRIAGVCREISLSPLLELMLRMPTAGAAFLAGRGLTHLIYEHILRCTQHCDRRPPTRATGASARCHQSPWTCAT